MADRTDKNFAIYLVSYSLFGLGGLLSWPLYPVVQVDRLQLSYADIGLLGLVESVTWLFSYLLWGRTIDKRGGLYVVRAIAAISMVTPLTYMFAQNLWMLLPSAIARGLGMAGFELGRISAGIQLADPDRVTEYAAIQSTVVGLRGMVAPVVTVGLLRLGAPHSAIFLLSVLFSALGWVMFGRVEAPTPGDEDYSERQKLRYRWPFRRRIARM